MAKRATPVLITMCDENTAPPSCRYPIDHARAGLFSELSINAGLLRAIDALDHKNIPIFTCFRHARSHTAASLDTIRFSGKHISLVDSYVQPGLNHMCDADKYGIPISTEYRESEFIDNLHTDHAALVAEFSITNTELQTNDSYDRFAYLGKFPPHFATLKEMEVKKKWQPDLFNIWKNFGIYLQALPAANHILKRGSPSAKRSLLTYLHGTSLLSWEKCVL